MIWFTSDTHFGHTNILLYANRPFDSIEEHDDALIRRWNDRVGEFDTVYHLGDFAFKKPHKYLERLKGEIQFVKGSHDSWMKNATRYPLMREVFVDVQESRPLLIVLCHYAMRSWNASHYGSYHLYGHHHGNLPPHGKSFDIGVDAWNYRPVSLDEVREHMAKIAKEE